MQPVTQAELLEIIDDMRARVAEGDSWEGYLNWLIPEPSYPRDIVALVEARYRIGNLQGQGGMRMIGITFAPLEQHESD